LSPARWGMSTLQFMSTSPEDVRSPPTTGVRDLESWSSGRWSCTDDDLKPFLPKNWLLTGTVSERKRKTIARCQALQHLR